MVNITLVVFHVVVDSALILKIEASLNIQSIRAWKMTYWKNEYSPPTMTWTLAWERENHYSAESDQPCPYLAARNPSCLDLADVFVAVLSELGVVAMVLVAMFHGY